MSRLAKYKCNPKKVDRVFAEDNCIAVTFNNGNKVMFGPYINWKKARQDAKKFCKRIKREEVSV